jgi:hypothetical protein
MLTSFHDIIYHFITCISFRATGYKGTLFYLTTFVLSCPHPTKCVGCRPAVYVNTISRQEAINHFAKWNKFVYIYASCNFPLKYTIGKNISVSRITLFMLSVTWVQRPCLFQKKTKLHRGFYSQSVTFHKQLKKIFSYNYRGWVSKIKNIQII